MRFLFVVCKVLQREAYLCASRSANVIDIILMPQGLHDEPERMRQGLQQALAPLADDKGRPYDAALLGYGLCSNGIVGVKANIPTVVPRGHDCITLLLGSRERYQQYFDTHRGVYWYSSGWIENADQPGRERYENTLNRYREKYGDENAEYLMRMEQNWLSEYAWATYVDWNLPLSASYREFTRESAEFLRWTYDELEGDPGLMQRLVDGVWDDDEFLVVQPGQQIEAAVTTPGIIAAR